MKKVSSPENAKKMVLKALLANYISLSYHKLRIKATVRRGVIAATMDEKLDGITYTWSEF